MSDFSDLAEAIDFKALFDAAPDAVVVHDLEDRVLFWNRAATRLYGWSVESMLGRPITECMYLDSSARAQAVEALEESGQWQGTLRQLDDRGDVRLVHVRQQLQRDARGAPVAVVSFNTEYALLSPTGGSPALAYYVQSTDVLSGGIAHDLNNAFAPISLSASMLMRMVEDAKPLSMIQMIERCAAKGTDLIAEILAFERGCVSGHDRMDREKVQSALEAVCGGLVPTPIEWRVELAENLWEFRVDSAELERCFERLLTNACEAMPDGGELRIGVANRTIDEAEDTREVSTFGLKGGNYVQFTFEDTGRGIEPTALSQVALPFYTTKKDKAGSGFGLSRTQATVKGHKGGMWIESAIGRGTTVGLLLPALEQSVVAAKDGS
jgi:PAS domain S-box-containing protein